MKAPLISTAGRIAEICRGELRAGDPALTIESITNDSRDIGPRGLFVPLIGERFDGHDYIGPLKKEGKIAAYLSMKQGNGPRIEGNGVAEILVDDTLTALGAIAAEHRLSQAAEVIGITGTNGKTTTKEMLHAVLSRAYPTLKNEKNFNNEIGVPFTLLGLNESHRYAVIEMGMNHPDEIDRLSRITRPNLAVITSIGEGHLEFLKSVEFVALAKTEIMNGMSPGSVVIANRDTDCFDIIEERAESCGLMLKSFGLTDEADIFPSAYHCDRESVRIEFPGEEITVPLYGLHGVYNLLAVIAVAEEFEISAGDVGRALADFENVSGRSEIIDRGYTVINDTYNSNPLSLEYALRSAAEIYPDQRRIAVLSDMKELGPAAGYYHREAGKQVVANGFSMLFIWGELADHYGAGARIAGMPSEALHIYPEKEMLIKFLKREVKNGDVVLVKGSRSMKMEEVVNALTGE